ncbi:unnamed protein product [Prorocentrum cordatum]|uniref:Pre-mRNA-splicing factor CWC25 n=1 Tax=Prorocentrum cordatum TaxID=2364126 RepID=A0ABN9PI84_9DINO|nr:unnamed protein product [Polarella glacialis]CAK0789956.1 unnamed protein product [Polarella glacialis]
MDRPKVERLDWMYEQSALTQKTDDELMNTAVAAEKDKDLEDVKKLGENTAGSLFLKSATKTTEDTLRKLREDPLFQIRRQEQAAKDEMLANPLIAARLRQKMEKKAKKDQKKLKKAAKKEKKKMKKLLKKEKKGVKKESSSSSDDSGSSAGAAVAKPPPAAARERRGTSPPRRDEPSPPRKKPRGAEDLAHLGPSGALIDKKAENAALIAERRDKALASRGATKRLSEEERKEALERMRGDAARHEALKDRKIAAAEQAERQQEEKEASMRNKNEQSYFKDVRAKAYGDEGATVADRLRNQRHRRQKHLNDPLERGE